MILSYKASPSSIPKNISKEIKRPQTNKGFSGTYEQSGDACEFVEVSKVRELVRKHELIVLQLNNEILKREIQLKSERKANQQTNRALERIKHDKMMMQKSNKKFENQRKQAKRRIQQLEDKIKVFQEEKTFNSPPKDRYDTCMRELDMLRTNLDDQQTRIKNQRDFYKDILGQIRSLCMWDQLSARELKNSLLTIFKQVDEEVAGTRNQEKELINN